MSQKYTDFDLEMPTTPRFYPGHYPISASIVPPPKLEDICRVCSQAGGELIAPCYTCVGKNCYVHRDCLDKSRANVDFPLRVYACEFCENDFKLLPPPPPERRRLSEKNKFYAFVLRDFFIVFFLFQFLLFFLSIVIHMLDNETGGYLRFAFHSFLREDNLLITYYVSSLIVFLSSLGIYSYYTTPTSLQFDNNTHSAAIYGTTDLVLQTARSSLFPASTCCACCCCCNPFGRRRTRSGGDGYMWNLLLGVFGLIFFTGIGLFYGIVLLTGVIQRILQRHGHFLELQAISKDYPVANLCTSLDPDIPYGEVILEVKTLV